MLIPGLVLTLSGVLGLYAVWRGGPGSRRLLLPGGWLLIAAGLALCATATSVERGLSIAMIGFVLGGALLTAAEAWRSRTPARAGRTVERAPPPAVRAPGRPGRLLGRWAGAILAAPALAGALAWMLQLAGPGILADRIVFSAFLFMAVWTAGLVCVLSSRRPWFWTLALLLPAAGVFTLIAMLPTAPGGPT